MPDRLAWRSGRLRFEILWAPEQINRNCGATVFPEVKRPKNPLTTPETMHPKEGLWQAKRARFGLDH